jgi:hypothetical protein
MSRLIFSSDCFNFQTLMLVTFPFVPSQRPFLDKTVFTQFSIASPIPHIFGISSRAPGAWQGIAMLHHIPSFLLLVLSLPPALPRTHPPGCRLRVDALVLVC